MENYQMFFPCSSSPKISTTMVNNSHEFYGGGSNNNMNMLPKAEASHDHRESLIGEEEKDGKLLRSCDDHGGDSTKKKGVKKIRKPKYAFQTRSHVDILDDGYRWRKYGQKAVKNNRFPRNYYRCTYQGCNVKKQVQRLTTDEGVVITTYEGTHSHSIEKQTENFEHILNQMQIYTPF
ncbi:probable WRKY transcription factor 75 [Rutidosis leptorrhynchoides]|uniref:probable WRKY transcription factor 75 n=1 Tax=Rutidosis leptorrhynchoides TaxID=125765 RepID=UPI003A994446